MFKFKSKFLQSAQQFRVTAVEGSTLLNGLTIIPLESFVKSGTLKTADEDEPEPKEEKKPKKDEEPKKDEKKPEEEQEFGLGAQTRALTDEEMSEFAGRVKNKEKTKLDPYTMPYVHHQNIKIIDGSGNEFDLESLKASIKQRPSSLLAQNEKMQHSDGNFTQFYNIGLPALKGLAVNEKTGEFVVVDTCPGSGSCKTFCYAMRGSYVMFKQTSMKQTQTLNFLLNDPKKFEARLKAEISIARVKSEEKGAAGITIRWHDAGDFFSPQYMKLAFDVALAFPDISFYAYTKIADVATAEKPDNFIISFSEGAAPREQKKMINMTQIKHSIVVPQKLFWDLIVTKGAHTVKDKTGQVHFKDEASWDAFKDRLVAQYKIPKDTILIYNQYIQMKKNDELGDEPLQWNVVVPPGGGDNSANDNLVVGSYLMWH